MPLTASYLTLAGSQHKDHQPRYSALDRAKAAHAVGIPAIGILLGEPIDPATTRYAGITECEWLELAKRVTPTDMENMRIARDHGCTLVKTGLCDNHTPQPEAGLNLWTVINAANDTGMTVAFEPVTWGTLTSLDDVYNVITGAGLSQDVGFCYDLWQVAIGTAPLDAMVPVDQIAKVEVCGIPEPRLVFNRPDYVELLAMDRPLLTESAINIPAWVMDLRNRGFTGPVTYEQPVARWRELTLLETAERAVRDMALLGNAADLT